MLGYLRLDRNSLSGSIPTELGLLTQLRTCCSYCALDSFVAHTTSPFLACVGGNFGCRSHGSCRLARTVKCASAAAGSSGWRIATDKDTPHNRFSKPTKRPNQLSLSMMIFGSRSRNELGTCEWIEACDCGRKRSNERRKQVQNPMTRFVRFLLACFTL